MMDPNRVQELATLLNDALSCVVIKRRRTSERMEVNSYRGYSHLVRASHNPDLRFMLSLYELEIMNADIKTMLRETIKEELSEHIQDDRMQTAMFAIHGGSGNGYPLDDYLSKLLDLAIVDGASTAAHQFYASVKSQSATYKQFAILSGLRLEHGIQIFEGIRLEPLPNSTSELPPVLPNVSMGFNDTDFLGKTLIAIDHSISPIFLKPSSLDTDSFKISIASRDAADFNLRRFCQALSLICSVSVQSVLRWTHVSDNELFNIRSGIRSGGLYDPAGLNNSMSTELTEIRLREAKDLYQKMLSLSQQTLESLQVPIDRWIKSKGSGSYVDKMIDLGIALEALYLRDAHDELRFRLSVRAAWHLGQTKEARIALIKSFRQIYGLRSKAVHTGVLPEEVTIDGERVSTGEFVGRAQDLCAESLKKVIYDGQIPDWDSLILG